MLDKKALDIRVVHVKGVTSLTDTLIICTSESLNEENIKAWHTEGYEHLNWVLIDYVNVVVNIFSKKAREYYDIERLWADAKIEKIS